MNAEMSSPTVEVASPCISVCVLNDDGLCTGCWRTVEEIADWRELGNEQKRAVVKRAAERAKASGYWL